MIQNDISNKIKNIMAILLIGILLFCISFFYQMQVNASSLLKVYFIDVGQGSSILVQSESKNTLIDTGDEKYYDKLDSFLSNNQINSIDQIVLTHNDPDHIGNVDRLIKTRKVGTVIQSKYGYKKNASKKDVKELNAAVSKYHTKTVKVKKGNKIDFGCGMKGEVLSPWKNYKKVNQTSLVIKMVYGKYSYLFTGDIYSSNEKELIKKYNVKSTVLQIPHHGSYTSSSEQFLKKVGAKYAVISCGKNNPYHHPRPEAMKRVKKYISNKNLYRTDQDGTILFINDGKKLIVKKE
jgi:competence protein ComEC